MILRMCYIKKKYLFQTRITEQNLENHQNRQYSQYKIVTIVHVSTVNTCVRFYYPLFFLFMNKAFYEYPKRLETLQH